MLSLHSGHLPHGTALMVAGDIKSNLVGTEGNHCKEEIFHYLAREGGDVTGRLLEVVVEGGY